MIVIGGGISGVACARRLQTAGLPVRLLERGSRLGGRMASRIETINGREHPVDIGAPYFTVREPRFEHLVERLEAAGLVRKWTDRFTTVGRAGRTGETVGPQRWSSVQGLRGLVEALAAGVDGPPLDVRLEAEVTRVEYDPTTGLARVDGEPASAVVLAMPDPQAARLLPADLAQRVGVADRVWSPALAVWAAWSNRWWSPFDGIFVSDSAVLSWVADSGQSRGDGAVILVAHTSADFARPYLGDRADPTTAIQPVLDELRRVIGGPMPPPEWERVHRWSLASAREPHPEPYRLIDRVDPSPEPRTVPVVEPGGPIAVCGDAWGRQSRVEQAWRSGDSLAEELIRRLTVSS